MQTKPKHGILWHCFKIRDRLELLFQLLDPEKPPESFRERDGPIPVIVSNAEFFDQFKVQIWKKSFKLALNMLNPFKRVKNFSISGPGRKNSRKIFKNPTHSVPSQRFPERNINIPDTLWFRDGLGRQAVRFFRNSFWVITVPVTIGWLFACFRLNQHFGRPP